MKKLYVFALVFVISCLGSRAQIVMKLKTVTLDSSYARHHVSFGIQLPVSVFASSHVAGAGLRYTYRQPLGKRSKLLALAAQAGADIFLGKRIWIDNQEFRFKEYVNLYAQAGLMINPSGESFITMTAGPTLGSYQGSSNVGFGANLNTGWHFWPRFAVGPGLLLRKNSKTDALWALTTSVSYTF